LPVTGFWVQGSEFWVQRLRLTGIVVRVSPVAIWFCSNRPRLRKPIFIRNIRSGVEDDDEYDFDTLHQKPATSDLIPEILNLEP
jgi:hypothetical protein